MNQAHLPLNYQIKYSSISVARYFLFSSLALIVVFAWMEPTGASGIGFFKGLLFWTLQFSILIPLLSFTQNQLSHCIKFHFSYSPWIITALAGLIGAILFVPIAYLIDILLTIPEYSVGNGILAGLWGEAIGVVPPVVITWIALNTPWIIKLDFSETNLANPKIIDKTENKDSPSLREDLNPPSSFLIELKIRAKGELISISSELHYLRVVTTESEVMFLYNLKDAINELPKDIGVQIHRSHWVSKNHIKEVRVKEGRTECVLSNDKSLPISRRKYSSVKTLFSICNATLALQMLAQLHFKSF